MRIVLTRLTIVAGVVFAASSFWLALGIDVPGVPMLTQAATAGRGIPYLPVFFIAGIMLMFLSAVVYELLPDLGASAARRMPRR